MKSHLRFSKASGSDRRKVEQIIRRGNRATRRQFVAIRRRQIESGESGDIYGG
ncbi:MAG: hypothetical protein P4L50_08615 [Anaerolineaceae bacterium]|nr:hypothetical protein [Anaerolineaceae bacterium]